MPATASPYQEPRCSSLSSVSDLEGLIPLRIAIKALPPTLRGGSRRIESAVQWVTRGVKTRGGQRVRLRALKTPGGWMCSSDWILEFFEALTLACIEADSGPLADIPIPTSPARRREMSAAI
jgi:hypothetical protein